MHFIPFRFVDVCCNMYFEKIRLTLMQTISIMENNRTNVRTQEVENV